MHNKRVIRRSGFAALGAAICATSLVGVSTAGATSHTKKANSLPFAGQTLTVFATGPNGTYAQEYQDYYNNLSALFHKETGATLQWQYYTSPAQEVSTIETATVSGSGPDVIGYGTSFVGTLQATGDFPLLSSKDWAVVGGKKAFFPAALYDSGELGAGKPTIPVKTIGIPYCTFPYVLAYNTADFKKAGIKSPPTTWTEFVQDAQKIQKAVPGVYGTGIDPQDGFDPWKNLWLYSKALGGDFISSNQKSVTLDSKAVEEATSFYFSLYYKFHIVPKQALTWNDAEMGSAFTSNKIAMFPIASETLNNVAKGTPLQGHLAFAPLPTVPYGMNSLPKNGTSVETMTTGGYWAIPGYARSKRQLALEFAKISTTPAMQVTAYKLLGYSPVTYAGIKALEHQEPASKPFIAAAQGAQPTTTNPVWAYIETGLGTAVNNIGSNIALNGKWDASYADQQLTTATQAANAHM